MLIDDDQETTVAADPGDRQARRPLPLATERSFGAGEMFFSTTDKKGIIRSGNPVFVKVSGYSLAELVGSPHNILRHPDMPRVMFKVVWEQLAAGHAIAAYIKNLAKDGSFYWVMAMITPCEGGYLSVRLKPSTQHFDMARELSLELLTLEQKTEGHDPRRRSEAIEASRLLLQQRLHDAGYADYTAFMREALLAEVRARTLLLARGRHGTAAVPADADGDMRVILAASAALSTFLERLVGKLMDYGI